MSLFFLVCVLVAAVQFPPGVLAEEAAPVVSFPQAVGGISNLIVLGSIILGMAAVFLYTRKFANKKGHFQSPQEGKSSASEAAYENADNAVGSIPVEDSHPSMPEVFLEDTDKVTEQKELK